MRPALLATARRAWNHVRVAPRRCARSFAAVPPGLMDSAGIIADPFEQSVTEASLRHKASYFMVGLAQSTELRRAMDFKPTDFSRTEAPELLKEFYALYGAQNRSNLRSAVTSPLFAKLKSHTKEEKARIGGHKGQRRKKSRKNTTSSNVAAADAASDNRKLGFKVAKVQSCKVVQVRALKDMKKELAFGQVTCEVELWLVPADFTANPEGDEVDYQLPFEVVPDIGRWRRAVDDKGQVYFWHTGTGFTQWQMPSEYVKVPEILPPFQVSEEHFVMNAETDEHKDIIVVKQLPVFEVAVQSPQKTWKFAGFAQ
eukprot:INCI6049.3.p1 GENE.INCI6049.3~~INCI6049.3.p1  ORF type:complete len:313 (+),score=54.94 INCI6049.3:209-1147(+)